MNSEVILKKDQIYHKLLNSIESGKLVAGSRMLREIDLATEFGVSRITLRSALNRLEQEGFIKRMKGRGTFISSQNTLSTAGGTVMVIHNFSDNFASPWLYIMPKIMLYAHSSKLATFTTTKTAFELFSNNEIKLFIKNKNIVGIIAIVNNLNGSEPLLNKLSVAKVPVVFAHAKFKDHEISGFPTIAVDERAAWETAINHLRHVGHRSIGIIGKNSKLFRGYSKSETLQLLADSGADSNPELIVQCAFDKTEIANAVKTLLNITPAPTALLCFSDFYAIYVYDTLAMLGIKIPDDIAVMGLCGYPDADMLNPPLSTVDYKYDEFAAMAVEMILEPNKWYDPKTNKGRLRVKSFTLKSRKSTKKLTKVVDCNKLQTKNIAHV